MCWCLDAFYLLSYCWKHHQHTTGNYNSQGGMHTRSWIKKVFGHSRKEDNLLPKPCKTKDSLRPQHATNWEIVCTNWEEHLLIGKEHSERHAQQRFPTRCTADQTRSQVFYPGGGRKLYHKENSHHLVTQDDHVKATECNHMIRVSSCVTSLYPGVFVCLPAFPLWCTSEIVNFFWGRGGGYDF